jgi:hypothetical protein
VADAWRCGSRMAWCPAALGRLGARWMRRGGADPGVAAQSPGCSADQGRRHASEVAAHPRLWRSC